MTIDKNEVIVIKTDLLLHPRDMEIVRKDFLRQMERGNAIILPPGFSYEVVKRENIEQEGEE
jgi:hypothetical protein